MLSIVGYRCVAVLQGAPCKRTVEAKIVGRRQPLWNDRAVAITRDRDLLTLRDLLTDIVTAEVEAFRERQEQQRLPQVLTKDARSYREAGETRVVKNLHLATIRYVAKLLG